MSSSVMRVSYNPSRINKNWKTIKSSFFSKSTSSTKYPQNGSQEIINKINGYFGYKLIDKIRLQTFNSTLKKEKKENILSKPSKKFEKKISAIKNKDIRNSLSQFYNILKND